MADLALHRSLPDGFGGRVVPGWCVEHSDFAWTYPDGSVACYHQCIVEGGSGDCVVVRGALSLPRGTVKFPQKEEG